MEYRSWLPPVISWMDAMGTGSASKTDARASGSGVKAAVSYICHKGKRNNYVACCYLAGNAVVT